MVEGDISVQARRVLDNVGALLKAGNLAFSDVVRTTIFLADMNDFTAVNEVYATYFSQPFPARATVQVARLPKDARVEIDAIAAYRLTGRGAIDTGGRSTSLCRRASVADASVSRRAGPLFRR